jgi:hypothetical protein
LPDEAAEWHWQVGRLPAVEQRGAAKTSKMFTLSVYDSPSGALRSHADSYHDVSFSLSLLHFIDLCDASFIIDVWQPSSVYDISLG